MLTGGDDLVTIEAKPTIAEGTLIVKPVRTREVLAGIRRSGGRTVAVSEREIEAAHGELARTGLSVEPTCASSAAALGKLLATGVVRPEETTGLKATQRIGELMGVPP